MNIGFFANLMKARKARQTALEYRKEQNEAHRREVIAKHKSLIADIESTCKVGNMSHDVHIPASEWNIIASCLRAKGYKVSDTPFYIKSKDSKKKWLENQSKHMRDTGRWEKEMFIKW